MNSLVMAVEAGTRHKCDNCDWIGPKTKLDTIEDPSSRLTPGGVVPSGQCPKCGALAYQLERKKPPSPYPEHEKLKAIRDQSQVCGQFFDWLQEEKAVDMVQRYDHEKDDEGYKIWRDSDGNIHEDYEDPSSMAGFGTKKHKRMEKMRVELVMDCRLVPKVGGSIDLPLRQPLTSLLAEFFEIDEDKLEEEKRAMLEACRATHEKKD